jgi:hypothetical protein
MKNPKGLRFLNFMLVFPAFGASIRDEARIGSHESRGNHEEPESNSTVSSCIIPIYQEDMYMYTSTIKRWTQGTGALSILIFLAHGIHASSFKADMIDINGADTLESKIFVQDSHYRMEMVEEGHEVFVIVDAAEGMTRVALVAEEMYFEMPSNDIRSLMKDPFQSAINMESVGESTSLGTEEIHGHKCEKIEISLDGTTQMTQWVSRELDFPLKIVINSTGRSVELENIQVEEELEDALFEIPEGFELMEQ